MCIRKQSIVRLQTAKLNDDQGSVDLDWTGQSLEQISRATETISADHRNQCFENQRRITATLWIK